MDMMEKEGSQITPKIPAWQHTISLLLIGRELDKKTHQSYGKFP